MRPLLSGRAQQVAGLVLLVFGLAVCWLAARLSLGEVSRPGPGFFPIVLGAMLALLAAWAIVEARAPGGEATPRRPPTRGGSPRLRSCPG